MKRTALAFCAFGILALVCIAGNVLPAAEKGEVPRKSPISEEALSPALASLEVKGVVESVTSTGPAQDSVSEITVTGEDGLYYTFLVRPTTTIYNSDWKAVTLDSLEGGTPVRVQYNYNTRGFPVAISIKPWDTFKHSKIGISDF